MRRCEHCGEGLKGRRDKRFCGSECRSAARRSRAKPSVSRSSEVFGSRTATFRLTPDHVLSDGPEAVSLAGSVGLVLDPWQSDFLIDAMGRDSAGRWAGDEACLVVPRQNGKTAVLVARALWGAVLGGEALILFTAHEFKTCREAFLLLKGLVESPAFVDEHGEATVSVSHGKEGITFPNGNRVLFIARTRTSGRGFSPDVVILDEAFELDDAALASLKPALSARSNPQMWFGSSAPHETSTVLRRVCLRGRGGEADRLTYYEWCADDDAASSDLSGWLQANPGIGYRLTLEYTASELDALEDDDFRRERLGIWSVEVFASVFDLAAWKSLTDGRSVIVDGLVFGLDVSPDKRAAVSACGFRGDGASHVEVVETFGSTAGVADRVAELVDVHGAALVVLDARSGANALVPALDRLDVPVKATNASEMVQAVGMFEASIDAGTVRHLDQPELLAALEGAARRQVGDAWALSRKSSKVDISPLVATVLAHWGAATYKPEPVGVVPRVINLADLDD